MSLDNPVSYNPVSYNPVSDNPVLSVPARSWVETRIRPYLKEEIDVFFCVKLLELRLRCLMRFLKKGGTGSEGRRARGRERGQDSKKERQRARKMK